MLFVLYLAPTIHTFLSIFLPEEDLHDGLPFGKWEESYVYLLDTGQVIIYFE